MLGEMEKYHNTVIKMNRILLLLFFLVVSACAPKSKCSYVVVDPYMQVVMETDDKDEAFQKAEKLTLFGRVFPSKPQYFVLEAKR
jgi:hypothetical protein